MAISSVSFVVVYAAVLAVVVAANNVNSIEEDDPKYCTCNAASINRRGFPDGFVFGSSSSAYQEDVRILKDMGLVDAYRFSISWSRILPGGTVNGGVNQDGIDYYNNLINELLANGIEPWITILHLDYPQALLDAYGGFLSSQIVNDFQDFAEILFSQFGDRVKHWITLNEPWGFTYLGYTIGSFAPGRCSPWIDDSCIQGDSAIEPYKVTHNQLLAHAAAVNLYKNKFQEKQKGEIGIVVNSFWFVPCNETDRGIKTKDRAFDFMLGWILNPITFGKYPESMRRRVGKRLPEFTKDEAEMLKGSFDFVGLNYYSAKYAVTLEQRSDNRVSYITDSGYFISGEKDGIPIGEQGSKGSNTTFFPRDSA